MVLRPSPNNGADMTFPTQDDLIERLERHDEGQEDCETVMLPSGDVRSAAAELRSLREQIKQLQWALEAATGGDRP